MENNTETLNLKRVNNVTDINFDATYVANYNGTPYFGKFINADTATFSKSTNFIWFGSIFPMGIPFESLESVYTVSGVDGLQWS
jgi:hypothetical protein